MPIHVNNNEYCRGAGKAGLSYEHWISHILGVNFHPASGHFLMPQIWKGDLSDTTIATVNLRSVRRNYTIGSGIWSISNKLTKLQSPALCTQCEAKGLLCNEERK